MYNIGDLVFVNKRKGTIVSKGFTKMIVTPEDEDANDAGFDCASFGTAYRVLFPEGGTTETYLAEYIRRA